MNEDMIAKWNEVVKPQDVVYHLGDFAYGHWKSDDQNLLPGLFSRLNGQKFLIRGNHDKQDTLKLPWVMLFEQKLLKIGKNTIHCSHYPIIDWDQSRNGGYHFHGHTHVENPLSSMPKEWHWRDKWRNLCVEQIGYRPRELSELIPG